MSALGIRNSVFGALGAVLVAGSAFAQEVDDIGWPREIAHPQARIVLYQPQVDAFEGNDITARAALSVTPEGQTEPVVGAAWIRVPRGDGIATIER